MRAQTFKPNHLAVISLGSNKGDRHSLMRQALESIQKLGSLIRCSTIHETEPWGFHADEKFLNQVLVLSTVLGPLDLLKALQKIEQELGKDTHSPTQGYASRTMDLDILFYDDLVLQTQDLTIPHPRIQERAFILDLLKEIKWPL